MGTFISILIVLAALATVLIVLVQNSKGGGLAASFSQANNIMGVRKSTDVLEKTTWWLAGIVMFLCVVSTIFIQSPSMDHQKTDSNIINAEKSNKPAQAIPSFDGGVAPAPVNEATSTEAPAEASTPATTEAPAPAN